MKFLSKWMFATVFLICGASAIAETSKAVPELDIATLDGSTFELSNLRGQWVVVNFWATWCPPCIKEMPELSALDAERKDVSVIGLAFEEIELDELKSFLKAHPVVYPIALVDVYNPPADFDTPRGLPLTYLIAPDGGIAEKIMGPVTRAELEKMIAEKQP
jgi:thiol-disulfide isomerase/thioredoxin